MVRRWRLNYPENLDMDAAGNLSKQSEMQNNSVYAEGVSDMKVHDTKKMHLVGEMPDYIRVL